MSGLYISGMEMPKNGELLCIRIHPDGKVTIDMDLKCKQIATAIPVPDHGRLGDLDALAAKDNDDFLKIMETADPATVFSTALSDAHVAIQEFLKAAPTIIPADKE